MPSQNTLVVVFSIFLVLTTVTLLSVAYKCNNKVSSIRNPSFIRNLANNGVADRDIFDTVNPTCNTLTSAFIAGQESGLMVVPNNVTTKVEVTSDTWDFHEYANLPDPNIAYIDVVLKNKFPYKTLPYIALPDAKLRPDGALLNITIHEHFFLDSEDHRNTEFGIRAPVTLNKDDNDNYSITYIPDSDTSNYNDSGLVVNPQIRFGGESVHQILVKRDYKNRGPVRLLLRSHKLHEDVAEAQKYVWTLQDWRGTPELNGPTSEGTMTLDIKFFDSDPHLPS